MKIQFNDLKNNPKGNCVFNVPYLRFNSSFILFIIVSVISLTPCSAQDDTTVTSNFDVNLELKNMHLWHGFVVTPGVMMASSIEYTSNNNKLIAGIWGGASFNGTYKEYSYYAHYYFAKNFSASLISHNNYSNSAEVNIFSYDKYTSPNFVDIVLQYTLSEATPIHFYWSTILFGNGGDFEINDDGSDTNSYSNYVELSYPIIRNDHTTLSLFAGGVFSFTTEKTFYSDSPNVNNIGIKLDREVEILSRVIPVSATGFWNPETKIGALQLAISMF
nr:hypothetical protein [uncultured Carboxylicivirga sp.]